ncbi:histidine phosphatase family protein [Hydrogenophaga taeniospiralis]|uniref:histidine phosphatase family protein n=1 Tax=Hydrogenophaga taeniospiralis TaxID=65656 RepID=UPI001CFB4FDB|nr:histidine phosphatase family protein [Hydrogenophaga taeniospiralis]MCB4365017.1 histidine phosphatase family protein [Hydrogenophaga taeniospiralis]
MTLWLLRHAPVVLDAGRCYGATDVPANLALTSQAARSMAALLPEGAPLWVSGLQRAQQLARELHTLRPDLGAPATDTRLNEMNFGRWELKRWDAIPRQAFDVWLADFAHHRFGGAESVQQLIDRVAVALAAVRLKQQGQAVWVTHAGVIRAVQYLVAHGSAPISDVDQWPREAPAPGGHLCLTL